MKRVVLIVLGLLAFVFASAETQKEDSYYYKTGFSFELDIHQPIVDISTAHPGCGAIGFGYRHGNGFDSSIVIGGDYSKVLSIVGLCYYQLRYHFFNSKLSPYVSAGYGVDYYHGEGYTFAPTARVAVGCSYGRFSFYFSYLKSAFSTIDPKVILEVGKIGFTYAF